MAIKPITAQSTDRMTCLVIGGFGKGKTSLLRTIPEEERSIVISVESGLLCVRDLVVSGRVEGFEITEWKDVYEVFGILVSDKYRSRYKWAFIDSLTEIAALCVVALKKEFPNPKDAIKMWGVYSERMTEMIKAFRDMPHYNVVFTALDEVSTDELGRRYTEASMQGKKVKELLPSYFDEVFYLDIFKDDEGNDVRKFVTQPIDDLPAKDRSGKLDVYEEPDLSKIAGKIMTKPEALDFNSSKMQENE